MRWRGRRVAESEPRHWLAGVVLLGLRVVRVKVLLSEMGLDARRREGRHRIGRVPRRQGLVLVRHLPIRHAVVYRSASIGLLMAEIWMRGRQRGREMLEAGIVHCSTRSSATSLDIVPSAAARRVDEHAVRDRLPRGRILSLTEV